MRVLDENKAYCRFFEDISKIPHGSKNEKALSDWIVAFAKARDLSWYQDDWHNVVVYKPASAGYEDHAPLMLQAHIDMVCEKNQDVEFDFEKDALKLKIEDGFLKADGTTLGADDGAGVAYMLAILDDASAKHPALECVFTTQEEIGLYGASGLDTSKLSAHRLINLDGGGEIQTLISAAGGLSCNLKKEPTPEPAVGNAYQISVGGCKGGHSGGEIDKERVNANKLLARILHELMKSFDVQLAMFCGGLKENAIPREAKSVVLLDASLAAVEEILHPFIQALKQENEAADAGLTIAVEAVEAPAQGYSKAASRELVKMMFLMPNGMVHRNLDLNQLVDASLNMGVVRMDEQQCSLEISLRSATDSMLDMLGDQVRETAELFGFEAAFSARYPGWAFEKTSALREQLKTVFKDMYGKELKLEAVHGGCECGIFRAIYDDMDIVTIGPITNDIHTPQEAMDLASFDRTYDLLTAFLEAL